MPQPHSSHVTLKLVLNGYLPATRNRLKGSHWSVAVREKRRAYEALRTALQSGSLSIPCDQQTGMDGILKRSKIYLSDLESFGEMIGIWSKGKSVPKRFAAKKKSGLR